MIRRDAEVIGHKPPLPRIGINEWSPAEAGIPTSSKSILELLEQDRIMDLIRQASEGNG